MIIVTSPSCSGKRRAFTLIELLVVISIISLLSSVVLSSLSTARSKARDARRLQDIKQIQTALELYRNDNQGYPLPGSADWSVSSSNETDWGSLKIALAPTYIKTVPLDPINKNVTPYYQYRYYNLTTNTAYLCGTTPWNNFEYVLLVKFENPSTSGLVSSWNQGGGESYRCFTGGQR